MGFRSTIQYNPRLGPFGYMPFYQSQRVVIFCFLLKFSLDFADIYVILYLLKGSTVKHKPLKHLLITANNDDTAETIRQINRAAKLTKTRPTAMARELIEIGYKIIMKKD